MPEILATLALQSLWLATEQVSGLRPKIGKKINWKNIGFGTKNEPKPKLLSPDIFRWGRGLPREGVGAKNFGMSLETQGIKLFWRDIPGFCRDIPEAPEKFEKKKFGFNSRPPKIGKNQLEKYRFWAPEAPLPLKIGKKLAKRPKSQFLSQFSELLAIFSYFPGEGLGSPRPIFFLYFSCLGQEAGNLFCSMPTGLQL